jgi:hypothetical protein
MIHACKSSYAGGIRRKMIKKQRPYLKNNLKQKGLEVWLTKNKALSPNPGPAKKEKKERYLNNYRPT